MAAENNDIEESEQKVDVVQEKKNSEKKKKQPRGPTYMPKVIRKKIQGERMPVSINRRGQFVGHNGTELQSYLGVLARQNVPISFPSWPKVSRELKDKIWEQAQAVYDVDVKARKLALSSAGYKWRQFKYKLAKNWILPFKDNPEKLRKPPKEYNFISPKEWETFVAIRLSAKFEKISEQASLRVREKKYHHRLSRRGYANTEMDLQTQSGITEDVERHELWKIAHQTKSGVYANEEVKSIVAKMDEIIEKQKEGAISFSGGEDVLTAALGPEHSGYSHPMLVKDALSQHVSWPKRLVYVNEKKVYITLKFPM
ncbi:hypothetical protein UlMin_015607 [Ulmus minor]